MTQRFLQPKARNLNTHQTVKAQDLTGNRFAVWQRVQADAAAQELAEKMTNRTGDSWQAFVEEYIPPQRRS